MKKLFILFLLLFFLSPILVAQIWSKRHDYMNGNSLGSVLLKSSDGLYVLPLALCNGNHFCSGAMKFDFDGNLLWKYAMLDSVDIGTEAMCVYNDTIYINNEFYNAYDTKLLYTFQIDY